MCGLVAVVDLAITESIHKTFWELLLVTSTRGLDSTGVATVNIEGNHSKTPDTKHCVTRYAKALGHPFNLRSRVEFSRLFQDISGYGLRGLLGHCRASTIGSSTPENAHPFDVGDIIGIHNGTIRTGLAIPQGETDSEALYEAIQKDGISCLKKIDGAYALIWFDKRDNTLNVLRNNERTLYFATTSTGIYFASEERFLDLAAAGMPVGFKMSGPQPVKPYHHGKIFVGTAGSNMVWEDVTDVCRFLHPTAAWGGFRPPLRGSFYDLMWDEEEGKPNAARNVVPINKGKGPTNKPERRFEKDVTDTSGNPMYPIGRNTYVTRSRHLHLLEKGCQWCGTVASEAEPVVWGEGKLEEPGSFTYDTYMCSECVDGDKETRIIDSWGGFDAQLALEDARDEIARSAMN